MERVALQDPPQGKTQTRYRPSIAYRLHGVLAARRPKTAAGRKQGTNAALIKPNQSDERFGKHLRVPGGIDTFGIGLTLRSLSGDQRY